MAAIYAVYLFIFPLIPTIDRSKTVLDIEMLLKNGRQWLAAVYIVGLGVLFYAYWRLLKIAHAFSKEQPAAAKSLRIWVVGIGVLCLVCRAGSALGALWRQPYARPADEFSARSLH